MEISNVLVISPPNYSHSQAFFDVAFSFYSAIRQYNENVIITHDERRCVSGRTLVFGAHLITKLGGAMSSDTPEDYIIYQTEQVSASNSLFVDDSYINLLKQFEVWDYSTLNIDALARRGVNAKHVPIGYSKCMSNIKTGRSVAMIGGGRQGPQRIDLAEWSGAYPMTGNDGRFFQDVDICFYGSVNERRQAVLDKLKNMSVKVKTTAGEEYERPLVVASFIGYGGFRDKIIARSKIVLNMHYYDSAIFEIFRCSHLFSNKKCVISELGGDHLLEDEFRHTGGFVTYNRLVDKCMSVLSDDAAREDIANAGFDIFRKRTQVDILKNV